MPYPETIVININSAEIKTLKDFFLNTNYIFYIFHVNNNILAKIKPKIKVEFNRKNKYNNNLTSIICLTLLRTRASGAQGFDLIG